MHMKCMLWFESRDRVIYCLRRRGFFVAVWRGYAVLRCIGFATETASRALSAGGAAEISAGPFRGLLFCSKMRRGRFEPERAWGADGGLLSAPMIAALFRHAHIAPPPRARLTPRAVFDKFAAIQM